MRYYAEGKGSQKIAVEINPNNQLGKGATAIIYKAEFNSEIVAAKIYHSNKLVNRLKISAMLSNKPDNIHIDFAGIKYPQIAWPFALLCNENGECAGYLMPLIDLDNSFPLDYFYDPVLFKKLNAPDEIAFSYKLEIAKNLSLVVAALHKNKHFFIDLKPLNIRVFRQTHIVSLVDCDGFSISDEKSGNNSRFPAELISTDYISPEAFRNKSSPRDLDENQDRYALAVILFQLLNNGTHPFQGILENDDEIATNDEKAAAGLYPHSIEPNSVIKPRPQSIHFLWDDKTRDLFDRAFIRKINERPSAFEWANHFEKLLSEKSLVRCDKEPLNIAHMRFKGKDCPSCYLNSQKSFRTSHNKTYLSKQEKINLRKRKKTIFGIEPWLIVGVIIFIYLYIVIGSLDKPQSNSNNSASTADIVESVYPTIKATKAVTEGWRSMDPEKSTHDYKHAYELNLKGYNLGHYEGASNIGLLYENGWGVEKDLDKALEWYLIATRGSDYAHSAQAELGVARVLFKQDKDVREILLWINKARTVATLSSSMWASSKLNYLSQANQLEKQINDSQKN